MTETALCLKCGSPIPSGTGFGMVACGQCGEINMLGSQSAEALSIKPLGESPLPETHLQDLPPPVSSSEVVFSMAEVSAPPSPPMAQMPEESDDISDAATRILQPDGSPQFSDVEAFGNQDLPSTGQGALVYDIKIAGIDTMEYRQQLADCLNDKRLGMDATELISKIKKGVLSLEQVNPVKAMVLLARLKHLPFKVTWSSQQLIKGLKGFALFLAALPLVALPLAASSDEWGRHEVNLKGYAARINSAQEEVEALIAKKNKNRDPKVRDALLMEIIKKNDDLKRIYKEFKAEKEHVRFEHPEQGDKTERKYRHVKMKSLEDMEGEQGLDGQLSRVKRKVQDQYPEPQKPAVTKELPKKVE